MFGIWLNVCVILYIPPFFAWLIDWLIAPHASKHFLALKDLIMLKILINARDAQDMRVAILKQQSLCELFIETQQTKSLTKGNIYLGEISSIEPSLNACFVKYLPESPNARHGFLPLSNLAESTADPNSETPLHEQIKLGQPLLVQVEREPRGTKGAALTNVISLAGSYLVLMPKHAKTIGISKRISSEKRDTIRSTLEKIEKPDDVGTISTAGLNCSDKEYKWDLDILLNTWRDIAEAQRTCSAPQLIYQEQSGIHRIIRDHLKGEETEIITDDPQSYNEITEFIQRTKPDFIQKVSLHDSQTPLFIHHKVEEEIKQIYQREIALPSGGTVVFDRTEALTAVDVNSARATKASNIEETAYRTNLEAARMVAKQVRLRDVGGLIVIDFIDMSDEQKKQKIEKEMRQLMEQDSAQVYMTGLSRFGLLEMSRQRIKPSIGDNHLEVCRTCQGRGFTRSVASTAATVLLNVEQLALDPQIHTIDVQLSAELCTYIINEKREYIRMLEQRHHIEILLITNPSYERTHFTVRKAKLQRPVTLPPTPPSDVQYTKTHAPTNKVMVQRREQKAPHRKNALSRLIEKIFGKPAKKKTPSKGKGRRAHQGQQRRHQNRKHTNQRNRRRPRTDHTKREVDNQVL